MRFDLMERLCALPGDLFLKERVHDDRRRACVLQTFHHVQVIDQWRCAWHQRMRQRQTEVGRGQVHVIAISL